MRRFKGKRLSSIRTLAKAFDVEDDTICSVEDRGLQYHTKSMLTRCHMEC